MKRRGFLRYFGLGAAAVGAVTATKAVLSAKRGISAVTPTPPASTAFEILVTKDGTSMLDGMEPGKIYKAIVHPTQHKQKQA